MFFERKQFLLILLVAIFSSLTSLAQRKDTSKNILTSDTVKQSFVAKMQEFAKASSKKSAEEFEADKANIIQNKVFNEVKRTVQKAKIYLKGNLDTPGIKTDLKKIDKDFLVAGDGVFTNKGTAQTFRNLTATSKILRELLSQANARKLKLDIRQQELSNFRYELDSLTNAPALFKFPTDSVTLVRYMQKLVLIAYEIKPVDSSLKLASNNIQALLNQVNLTVFKLENNLGEIETYQKEMAGSTYKQEFEYIWNSDDDYRPFDEILSYSKIKGLLTLSFYTENNVGKLFTLIILIFISFVYLRSLKGIYQENKLLKADFEGQLVLKYPFFSALLLILSLFQFIFFSPPFILNLIFWATSCISLTIIFKSYVSRYWMGIWLFMVFLFFIAAVDNLVLQASRTERWLMLVTAIAGIFIGLFSLTKGHREDLKEKWILYAIGFMVALEAAAVVANLFGRYNLAKTLFLSGYLNVVVAILFLWVVRFINEGLFLAFNVYTGQDRKLFYLNFERVGKRAPLLFYMLLFVGWLVLFGRNFPAYEYFSKPLKDFFGQERTIGSYTFSINNMMLFIAIMVISVVVSKIVSFFASDRREGSYKDGKTVRQGIGSWLLLVRITILAIGLFLAVAAAGIPVDRIVIVLGALGVGIGFGLQTLVNNLVSGLIIAFEKPVNVGDIVDVDGQGGTVKSIGFRSSVISTWDGADVVMPNGDLLNSHLVNWSLGGNRKRVAIQIGVAYDSDLEKVRVILLEILNKEPRVSKSPVPVVQFEQFNSSSIDVKIYFWTKHIGEVFSTKSDLIIAVNDAFKDHNIVIPFPQHEVYIRKPEE